jgi:hypothetical protein
MKKSSRHVLAPQPGGEIVLVEDQGLLAVVGRLDAGRACSGRDSESPGGNMSLHVRI